LFGQHSKKPELTFELSKPKAEELEISNIADATPEASEAKALVLTGQITQAEYLLETILEKNPANCDVWHAIGHARRLQDKHEAAIEAYSHAIDVAYRYHSIIHFEHSASCLQRALILFSMGEEEKAKADVEQAIFQDHSNQPALMLQQQGWQRGMEFPEYESNLMTALACEQEIRRAPYSFDQLLPYQQAHDKAIYYWRHGDAEHAIGIMSEMLQQNPDYAMAWHHRALMFLELGDTRQAHADLDKAIEAGERWHMNYHHGAAMHHLHRGQMHHHLNDSDMAMMDYSKAVDIDKNLAEGHFALGIVHLQREQYPTALSDLDKAISLDPRPQWQEMRNQWAGVMGG
jgi:tetratricopeptide (TPR) repeat protein